MGLYCFSVLWLELFRNSKTNSLHPPCLKVEDADRAAAKAEKARKEVLQLDAEIERLRLVYAELMERKQQQQRQIQRHGAYRDFMVRVVRMTKVQQGHLKLNVNVFIIHEYSLLLRFYHCS